MPLPHAATSPTWRRFFHFAVFPVHGEHINRSQGSALDQSPSMAPPGAHPKPGTGGLLAEMELWLLRIPPDFGSLHKCIPQGLC